MEWHLYKKDDPNTWPKIDCPIAVYLCNTNGIINLDVCKYNKEQNWFIREEKCNFFMNECYYAYIGYIPNGYKTLYPIICTCENCPEGYDDEGYCMDYDDEYACGYKCEIAEYEIKEKRIWKEFE